MARETRQNKLYSMEDPKSIISEAFRSLRTNIQYANIDKNIKSILLTSTVQKKENRQFLAILPIPWQSLERKHF